MACCCSARACPGFLGRRGGEAPLTDSGVTHSLRAGLSPARASGGCAWAAGWPDGPMGGGGNGSDGGWIDCLVCVVCLADVWVGRGRQRRDVLGSDLREPSSPLLGGCRLGGLSRGALPSIVSRDRVQVGDEDAMCAEQYSEYNMNEVSRTWSRLRPPPRALPSAGPGRQASQALGDGRR